MDLSFTSKTIKHKRQIIYNKIKHLNITTKLIKFTFKSIIQSFFDKLNIKIDDIDFKLSLKMTSTAGRLDVFQEHKKISYQLVISKSIINNLQINTYIKCHGIKCYDSISCFICILEHELIHYLIDKYYPKERHIEHSKQFKELAYNVFRHTQHEHELLSIPKHELKINYKYKIKINGKIEKVSIVQKYKTKVLVIDKSKTYYHVKYHMFKN
jgi:hypothetical protein